MDIEVIRQESDVWSSGVAFLHKGPARVARRVQFNIDHPFYYRNYKIEDGDWVVNEVAQGGEPEGEPTYTKTEEAAIDVANAIVKGEWR